jgi:hypothetical protein
MECRTAGTAHLASVGCVEAHNATVWRGAGSSPESGEDGADEDGVRPVFFHAEEYSGIVCADLPQARLLRELRSD